MERRARLLGLDALATMMTQEQGMQLVRDLIDAIKAEVDDETAWRIRRRVGRVARDRALPVDSSSSRDESDGSTDDGGDDRSCSTREEQA